MYSLIATFSIFVCGYLIEYLAKQDKSKVTKNLWELILMVVLFGTVGARLYHVVHLWPYYQENLWQILNFRAGGLGIYGGLIGGVVGGVIGSYAYRVSFKAFIVYSSIVLPLGQAIGRFGNFFNYELYGKPYQGFFKIYIPFENRVAGVEGFEYFHPLFFYEAVLNFVVFFLFFYLWKTKRVKVSDYSFVFLYLLAYGIIRALLEPLRINAWNVLGVPVASYISISLILLSSIFFITKFKKNK